MFLKKCLCGEKTKGAEVRRSLSTAYSLTHLKKKLKAAHHIAPNLQLEKKYAAAVVVVVFKHIHAHNMTTHPHPAQSN